MIIEKHIQLVIIDHFEVDEYNYGYAHVPLAGEHDFFWITTDTILTNSDIAFLNGLREEFLGHVSPYLSIEIEPFMGDIRIKFF